jgi:hypothetical protein
MAHRGRQPADEALLTALACGATVENAARAAGISPRTAHRRLADPAFQQRVQAARADMVQRAAGLLTAAALEAVKTLLNLQQTHVSAAVRLSAARAILDMGMKLREAADFETRLTELERRVAEQEGSAAGGGEGRGV